MDRAESIQLAAVPSVPSCPVGLKQACMQAALHLFVIYLADADPQTKPKSYVI